MVNEILGALEFAAFLAALAWLCYRIERMPWYRRLNAKLFPEVNDDAD